MQPGAKYLKRSEWSLRHIFKQVVVIINHFISTHMFASNIAIFEAMLMVSRTYVEMIVLIILLQLCQLYTAYSLQPIEAHAYL